MSKRKGKSSSKLNIVFRKNTNIGAADAESDQLFLENCFVDTGDLQILQDCNNPNCIVLGRTGVGKTALLKRLKEKCENVIEISPETLALNHISNSNVITFFEEIGVRLDKFYKLLWNHVITVELLTKKYDVKSRHNKKELFERILERVKTDKSKEKALNYLDQWGDQFWEETEHRIKEFTTKLENDLKGSVGGNIGAVKWGVEGAKKLSEEQKEEIINRARDVVNRVQLNALRDLIQLLEEDIFVDVQNRYYIIIDRLDEDWVEDEIRYKLVRSLIECIRDFQNIRSVKIIVAIRSDLMQSVIRKTRGTGFQEEKYESLYLKLKWSKSQIEDLLNKRINFIFQDQYTNRDVKIVDVLPKNQIQKKSALDYIVDRTLYRPREAIQFINSCIEKAEGRSQFSVQILREAEMVYSQKRIKSLEDEWRTELPNLRGYLTLLEKAPPVFRIDDIETQKIKEIAFGLVTSDYEPLIQIASDFYSDKTQEANFLVEILYWLYRIGVVGIKNESHIGTHWVHMDDVELPLTAIDEGCAFAIHPAVWMALGVSNK